MLMQDLVVKLEPTIGLPIAKSVQEWFEASQGNGTLPAEPGQVRDILQHDLEAVFRYYGGPQQFLEAALTPSRVLSSLRDSA